MNQVLDTVLADFSDTETFKKRRFFPYLSDSSYLAMRETADEIKDMLTDFPMSDTIYPVPFDTIRSLAIPAIDLGVYGKVPILGKNGCINLILMVCYQS